MANCTKKSARKYGGLSDFGFETWVAPNVLMKSDESWLIIVKHGESENSACFWGCASLTNPTQVIVNLTSIYFKTSQC